MERFDRHIAQEKAPPQTNGTTHSSEEPTATPTPRTKTNSPQTLKRPKEEDDEDAMSDVITEPKAKKKRIKDADSDAAYAAKLQAMENARGRATRGGGPKATKAIKKKTPKKKSSGRVKAEDDSDIEGSGSEAKERKVNRNTGFHVSMIHCSSRPQTDSTQKELTLSPSLSALLNETKVGVATPVECYSY